MDEGDTRKRFAGPELAPGKQIHWPRPPIFNEFLDFYSNVNKATRRMRNTSSHRLLPCTTPQFAPKLFSNIANGMCVLVVVVIFYFLFLFFFAL